MKVSKQLLISAGLFFLSLNVLAEHNKTYCGTIVQEAVEIPHFDEGVFDVVIKVDRVIDFEDKEEWDEEGYAGILVLDDEDIQLAKNAKPSTRFCAKGRWGGALYSSYSLESLNLTSDNIWTFNYETRFTSY